MTQTFFTKNPATHSVSEACGSNYIAIGGAPFHSAAVSFMDAVKKNSRINDLPLKAVLDNFFTYFPKFKFPQSYLGMADRMRQLIRGARTSEMEPRLAIVLQQLAIDEIYGNPLKYKEVLEHLTPSTPRSYLRDPVTPVPISALRGLTPLGITFCLSFVEAEKELRRLKIYSTIPIKHALELVLQVQHHQSFPKVQDKADFAYVGKRMINPPQFVVNPDEYTNTVADLLFLIDEDNKKLLHHYDQLLRNLELNASDYKLSKDDYIRLYIEFLPDNNEYYENPMQFFARLQGIEKKPVTTVLMGTRDQQIIKGIINALAAWSSMQLIDEELLFDRMEQLSVRGRSITP